ncbi:hypothetical protein E2C01_037149 [Portunus trituberculatus]|uniref:Uncharacterized protein n=1 Tax=Portunus trituberculatus TaxID=210409 RepID=A0A5B7F7D0_PORTR|nr:hypothetical protein [Portunus trituberculatus]
MGCEERKDLVRPQEEDSDYQQWLGLTEYEFSSPSGYAHNTYHGPSRHARPALVLEPKPLRFTDSPQHFVSDPGALPPGQHPPRRKSSSASNDSEVREGMGQQRQGDYIRPDYRSDQMLVWGPVTGEQHATAPTSSSSSSKVAPLSPKPEAEVYRSEGHYAQYSIEHRGEPLGYYYSSQGGAPPEYLASVHYEQRVYPPYVMRHTAAAAAAAAGVEGGGGYHAYDNPSTSVSSSSTSTNPHTPSRLNLHHRRTPSSVSNASSSSSNINPSFKLEDEGDSSYSTPTHRSGHLELHPGPAPPPRVSRQNSHDTERSSDRPGSLDLPRHHHTRSSLRKYNYSLGRSSPKPRSGSGGSGGGTPTNPTPPDSMTSEDSSYVSAPDMYSTLSGGSGGNSTGRVRFSPATQVLEGIVGRHTLLDMPVEGQSQDTTVPLTAVRQTIRQQEQQKQAGHHHHHPHHHHHHHHHFSHKSNSWTAFDDGSDERLWEGRRRCCLGAPALHGPLNPARPESPAGCSAECLWEEGGPLWSCSVAAAAPSLGRRGQAARLAVYIQQEQQQVAAAAAAVAAAAATAAAAAAAAVGGRRQGGGGSIGASQPEAGHCSQFWHDHCFFTPRHKTVCVRQCGARWQPSQHGGAAAAAAGGEAVRTRRAIPLVVRRRGGGGREACCGFVSGLDCDVI